MHIVFWELVLSEDYLPLVAKIYWETVARNGEVSNLDIV